MHPSFSRTLRSLRAERSRGALLLPLGASALLLAWVAWLGYAPLTLYARSTTTRVEAREVARPVAALFTGRVVAVHASLGERVRAGDVLYELDPSEAQLELEGARALLPSLGERRKALERAIAVEEQRQLTLARAGEVELAELAAWTRRAESTAATAEDDAQRSQRLRAEGVIADAQAQRLLHEAAGEQSQSEAMRRQEERRRIELDERVQGAQADLQRLRSDCAEVVGDLVATEKRIERLEHALAERSVRAPIDGLVGELSLHRPGAVVEAGEELAAIVPEGELVLVADFPVVEAAGRIAPGQRARMRFDGFPWAQYGSLEAHVRAVASEPGASGLRVELEPSGASSFTVPLRHGMTGTIEVEVERITPLELVLRTVGRRLSGSAQEEQP